MKYREALKSARIKATVAMYKLKLLGTFQLLELVALPLQVCNKNLPCCFGRLVDVENNKLSFDLSLENILL